MSNITNVYVADRISGGSNGRLSADISIFDAEPYDDGESRVCMALHTGCSSTHIRMTRSECETLIAALQKSLATFPVAEAA